MFSRLRLFWEESDPSHRLLVGLLSATVGALLIFLSLYSSNTTYVPLSPSNRMLAADAEDPIAYVDKAQARTVVLGAAPQRMGETWASNENNIVKISFLILIALTIVAIAYTLARMKKKAPKQPFSPTKERELKNVSLTAEEPEEIATDLFRILNKLDTTQLAYYLKSEKTATVVQVLSRLPEGKAAEVLALLPPSQKEEVSSALRRFTAGIR